MSKFLKSCASNPLVILWVTLFGANVIQRLAITHTTIYGVNYFAPWVNAAYWAWSFVVVLYIVIITRPK